MELKKLDTITQIKAFKRALDGLSYRQAVVFCTTCAERLLPNYFRFTVEDSWGDPVCLRAALDLCWYLVTQEANGQHQAEIAQMLESCESLTPDTEDFRGPSASAALDAANVVCYALSCLQTRDIANATYASQSAIDTVDLYLRGMTTSDGLLGDAEEKYIYSHELMLQEIRAQEWILSQLTQSGEHLSKDQLQKLRYFCWNGGESNIGAIWRIHGVPSA